MENTQQLYKKSFKGIAVFGGLQLYKIALSIITTKVSAIFLGPVGTGVYGLFTSILGFAESIACCGLGTSAVKEISQANSKDGEDVSTVYTVLNRLVWITGFLGSLLVFLFAKQLCNIAFGNSEYINWLRILSITVLLNQLQSGQGALLTGLQRYRLIAKQRMLNGFLSAVLSIGCYSCFGIDGIIPVILLTSFINLVVSCVIVRSLNIRTISMRWIDILNNGAPMFKMGVSIGLSYALTTLAGFALRAYIAQLSDVATVGLFTASYSLINTYLGLVFSSIESDYYPRLSACLHSGEEYRKTMLSEIELLMLLLTPLVLILIIFSQPVLAIFYSSKFYAAQYIIAWSAMSMLVRVPSWAMSIGLISMGETKLYLKNQMAYIVYQLGISILGFTFGGLSGLGISFVIIEVIYCIQNYLIQRKLSELKIQSSILVQWILAIGVTLGMCLLISFGSKILHYTIGTLVSLSVASYCVWQLNKRMEILLMLKNKFSR